MNHFKNLSLRVGELRSVLFGTDNAIIKKYNFYNYDCILEEYTKLSCLKFSIIEISVIVNCNVMRNSRSLGGDQKNGTTKYEITVSRLFLYANLQFIFVVN